MVPTGRWTDKPRMWAESWLALRKPLAWGVLLWAVVVAAPYVVLFPEHGLNRPMLMALASMPLVAMLVASASGQPQLLLGIGLAAQLPILVACPPLLGPRAAGAIQGVTIGVLILLFVAGCFDIEALADGSVRPVKGFSRLRRLLVWPTTNSGRLVVVLGCVWLAIAWWVGDENAVKPDKLRATRTAAVALCWMATQSLAIGRWSPARQADTPVAMVLRRLVWCALVLGAWLWLRAGGDAG